MSENNISKSITSNDISAKRNNNNNQEPSKIINNMSEDESKNNNKITKSGWLLKWTNYLKGTYEERSFGMSRLHHTKRETYLIKFKSMHNCGFQ